MATPRRMPTSPGAGCVVLGPRPALHHHGRGLALLARDGAVLPALWRILEAHGRARTPTDHDVGEYRLRVLAGGQGHSGTALVRKRVDGSAAATAQRLHSAGQRLAVPRLFGTRWPDRPMLTRGEGQDDRGSHCARWPTAGSVGLAPDGLAQRPVPGRDYFESGRAVPPAPRQLTGVPADPSELKEGIEQSYP